MNQQTGVAATVPAIILRNACAGKVFVGAARALLYLSSQLSYGFRKTKALIKTILGSGKGEKRNSVGCFSQLCF